MCSMWSFKYRCWALLVCEPNSALGRPRVSALASLSSISTSSFPPSQKVLVPWCWRLGRVSSLSLIFRDSRLSWILKVVFHYLRDYYLSTCSPPPCFVSWIWSPQNLPFPSGSVTGFLVRYFHLTFLTIMWFSRAVILFLLDIEFLVKKSCFLVPESVGFWFFVFCAMIPLYFH